jgi:hypothetical protein
MNYSPNSCSFCTHLVQGSETANDVLQDEIVVLVERGIRCHGITHLSILSVLMRCLTLLTLMHPIVCKIVGAG